MYIAHPGSAAKIVQHLVRVLTRYNAGTLHRYVRRNLLCAVLIGSVSVLPATNLPVAHAASGLTWDSGVTIGPVSLARPAVTLGHDGNVYVFGGTSDSVEYNTTFIYQPSTNSWSLGAPMPVVREGAQAITLPDGRMAVLGGATHCAYNNLCSAGTVYNRVDVYTPSTNSWSTLAPMQSPRYRFAAVLYHGQIYAIGGSDGTQALASVEAYDPISDTWSAVAGLPQATLAPDAVATADGHIDVFGGFDGGPYSSSYDTFWIYDGNAWSSGPSLLQPETDGSATVGPDGQIYVMGGFDHDPGWLTTVQVYNPNQNVWSFGTALPSPTCCSGTVTVPGGQIYIVNGGVSASSQFDIYGPSIFLAPPAGLPGSTAALTGTNFAPGANVQLFWGSDGSGQLLATGTTDSNGATIAPISFTVPATATPGAYIMTAIDDQSQYPVTTTFVVPDAQPSIPSLSTAGGSYGQAVKTTGASYAPREAVVLYWDRLTSPVARALSTATGGFNAAFTVPSTTGGVHYLIALGLRSHRWSYRRFVVRPRSVLANATAAPGTPNHVSLFGFAANATVNVYWRSPSGALLGTATTNAAGSAALSFTTPSGTPSTYNVLSTGPTIGGISTLVLT